MFYFQSRNKATEPSATNATSSSNSASQTSLEANIEDAKKRLYDSIILRRTDIVISLINEWFKGSQIFFFCFGFGFDWMFFKWYLLISQRTRTQARA